MADPLNLTRFVVDALPKNAKLRNFYNRQNELIDSLISPSLTTDDFNYNLVYCTLAANICLVCLQLTAAIISKSLVLFATTADAFMDVVSQFVMLYTVHLSVQKNYIEYPIGKSRYETTGIIIFSSLMATVSFQIIITSVQDLISQSSGLGVSLLSIICIVVAISTKLCLYLYCRTNRDNSIKILALDHFNDIVVNTVGLTFR